MDPLKKDPFFGHLETSEEVPSTPSKMIYDFPIIPDNHMDHLIFMKDMTKSMDTNRDVPKDQAEIEGREVIVASSVENESKISNSKKESSGTKRYACPCCSYSSQRRDELDEHVKNHVVLDGRHPSGKKRRKTEALPQRHRYEAEEYRCRHCRYSCTVLQALTEHLEAHVLDEVPLKLSCKICGKDWTTEKERQRHTEEHKKGDHLKCDLCSFTSVQLKKVIEHRRVHTGEKPHECPDCSFRSARRDNLRSHVRKQHDKENVYIDTFNHNEAA